MKNSPKNPDYSLEHRLGVILEDLQSQFRNFGEGLSDLQEKVSNISDRLERIEERLDKLEVEVSVEDLNKLEKRLTTVETHR